ncbi:GDSL-type esterase/lipase family protein [Mucilaginibacter sabulilitoris]|uniref:GDSL-type esterase/lipase family protein n=1 Tax=Mucilaginibacter sabulilitoris TaxID=1173583 RepID=A0ABZ0THD5_9SPHI|nr:GDSL-type esterase/lipase family protein [Mucilaginibacter sabulilitoris]WPU92221.1 GDSL-type esterase/lipase family protein [Mucilaginibacter sabulilitoris]
MAKELHLSKKKIRWFKGLAMLTPIVLMIIFECVLRLVGYGHDTNLFIRYPDDPSYWVINKYASEPYFSDTANATRGNIEIFKVKKAANTVRLFVLGESTTAGYPYGHNGSFHRWLQYRLMHNYPGIHFEIINVSLTAINSYTVLDFGKQILDYQPDGVLIYTGHNEYYGALGTCSTSHIANNRMVVKLVIGLRHFRTVQLIENIYRHIKNNQTPSIDKRENLMKRMAASQEIRYGSTEYYSGINQFKTNMDELCGLLQHQAIPVFLSTLVSNEKDQAPFISSLRSANAADNYKKANILYASGNYRLARQQFVKAKELDMLRFRAPEAINDIIESFAIKYKNVHIVDAKKTFEQHSPHQILGYETLLEHVHPNLYGYALLSDAFYQSIEKANLIKGYAQRQMSFQELILKMPVTRVDSLYGVYTIMMLKSGWPFNDPIPASFKRGNTTEEQLAGSLSVNRISWAGAMDQLFRCSMRSNDKKTALKAVEAVLLESPQNITYKIYAARLNFDLNNFNDAEFYFKMAYDQEQSFENVQNMYLMYLKTDQPEKSLPYVEQALRLRPQDVNLPGMKSIVKNITDLKSKLKSSPGNPELMNKIGLDYHIIAVEDVARKYGTTY